MIVHKCNVVLTKVQYLDAKNAPISIISETAASRRPRANLVIKRNVFGLHTWILKVNESDAARPKRKLAVYAFVFVSLACVLCFGLFFAFCTPSDSPKPRLNESAPGFCDCSSHQVCLKIVENSMPVCTEALDRKDPTGCGGLCAINEEYCKKIDFLVYQCRRLVKLNCSRQQFNCGNRCVPLKMRCDGVINCSGHVDEKNCDCDLTTHFRCGNATSCLHLSKRCDGTVDCWDNFDEIGCGYRCPGGKVPCRNGQCVDKEHFCDGRYQCIDKSDEFRGCEVDR